MNDDLWVSLENFVSKSLSRPGMKFVYEDALRKFKQPLIMRATNSLIDCLVRGESVVVFTGFRTPPLNVQETDGPCGAAFLSKCLSSAGFRTHIVIEENPNSLSIAHAALSSINAQGEVQVNSLPAGSRWLAHYETLKLVKEINPSAAIFVEKPAPNDVGVYHSMRGFDVSKYHIDIKPLMKRFIKNGVITIGVGDGGNEVGMGVVKESVRKYVPYGNLCNCPCRGGIASAVPADYLVISETSNLGAYALAAGVFLREGIKECLISYESLEQMIKACVSAGAIDGVTGLRELSVDGYSINSLRNFIKELRKNVTKP